MQGISEQEQVPGVKCELVAKQWVYFPGPQIDFRSIQMLCQVYITS